MREDCLGQNLKPGVAWVLTGETIRRRGPPTHKLLPSNSNKRQTTRRQQSNELEVVFLL